MADSNDLYERRDVWALSDEQVWHPTIEWYARAVRELQSRDTGNFADPSSWRHLAEIHGSDIDPPQWPPDAHWDECQHSTWFFLPWHRMYLHHFEKIVRAAVVQLGGPSKWALPYWNYSDPDRPQTRVLPPAFRERTLSRGGSNPLRVDERAPGINDGLALGTDAVSIADAWKQLIFTQVQGGTAVPGFGGPNSGRNHGGGTSGKIEQHPHDDVHMEIGGFREPRGWMSLFDKAARDPIFWLHHANIDRLWAAWLRLPGRKNPPEEAWRGERFAFGRDPWRTDLAVHDVLDTTAAPLRYRYGEVAPAPRLELGPDAAAADVAVEALMSEGPPELVGASKDAVPLSDAATSGEVEVSPPRGVGVDGFAGEEQPGRVYLRIENVRGRRLSAPAFLVYLNVPPGASPEDHPMHRAGKFSMFGVHEYSDTTARHGGSGLSFSFDITDVVRSLRAEGAWDPQHLRVTFVPVPDSAGRVDPGGDVRVGRISLYYG